MQYRDLGNTGKISTLGYGCMRFPTKNGKIDEELTEKQIMYAIENGVNYFDTAYVYNIGKSEIVLGNILAKNKVREKVYIADKLPPYLVKSKSDIDKIFNTQLKRLSTNYIDYYLMHMLSSLASWERLKQLGILEFIDTKKRNGEIRYIGFSFHGKVEEFKKIIDDYNWDFCQIQYNYLDEYNQAGKEGLEYAYNRGVGVVVMEPLRGGSLAGRMPDAVKKIIDNANPKRSAADWGLRWIWNHKEVSVVLSGMNDNEHISENIRIACETIPNSMDEKELNIVEKIKKSYKDILKVPCTGCEYCMPCPFGVNIPFAFNAYNTKYLFNNNWIRFQYNSFTSGISGGERTSAWVCKECGQCEKKCPQSIKIRDELKKVTKEFRNPIIDFVIWVLKKINRIR